MDALALHSERLVETLVSHARELLVAKIGDADRAALTGRVATLSAAEKAWARGRKSVGPGAVAEARVALTLGREDLHGALRVFVKDAETQRRLDEVGGVEDDDDLAADVEVLLSLARAHAELTGTEITPAHFDAVARQFADFRAARVGVPLAT